MKNHFIYSYIGNKREEVEKIYNGIIENNILKDEINIICEPYCGSSAMSVYIAMMHPKKYKYILNDNDSNLIELYKILQDDDKLNEFIFIVNSLCFIEGKFINKEEYLKLKTSKTIYTYFIMHKYYNICQGIYPHTRKSIPLDINDIKKKGIYKFLHTEEIQFYNNDSMDIINNNNNTNTLILLDPPYISTCNESYTNAKLNIYQWYYYNKDFFLNACFILEKMWVVDLLFNDCLKIEYEKKYNGVNKKVSKHLIIKV